MTGDAGSFHIEQEVEIRGSRERVWSHLLDVDGWWSHRVLPTGSRLVLEPKVGGRFYERWGDDEGALWGLVTYMKSPEALRMSGPLGMSTAASNIYEFRLEERGGSTLLQLSHWSSGVEEGEHKTYDAGWRALWVHFKALVESGRRFARPVRAP